MAELQIKRQVVLDTETTGLSTADDHRIIEIGCVELVNRRLTGKTFHQYINPEREIDSGAIEVHGITNESLADKPKFVEIVDDNWLGNRLVGHNGLTNTFVHRQQRLSLVSLRFHTGAASISLRSHIELTAVPHRFHFGQTSKSFRSHFDPQRLHFYFTSGLTSN